MMNTTISKRTDGKVKTFERKMMKRPGYVCYKLPASLGQQKSMLRMAERLGEVQDQYISNARLAGVDRVFPFAFPLDSREGQKGWICSELVMFLLQENLVVPKVNRPASYDPTALFKEISEYYPDGDVNGECQEIYTLFFS